MRVRGQAPLQAKVYELERLRCNLCGKVFRAKAPEGVGEKKYTTRRLGEHDRALEVRKRATLQPTGEAGRKSRDSSSSLDPVGSRQRRCWDPRSGLRRADPAGSTGGHLYNDDTSTKILRAAQREPTHRGEELKERTGIFTSAIVATCNDHKIAVFFTGRQHAGENLGDVLREGVGARETDPDVRRACHAMNRRTSRNDLGQLHVPRSQEIRGGGGQLSLKNAVTCSRPCARSTGNDAIARKEEMSPEERLRFHQDHSAKIMADLQELDGRAAEEKNVEPNSSLGGAFSYMLKRWDKLTLFLRKPGAPLDNNICERALKKAILHRKNALFYKTENGARVGDIFMSLIYTAELSRVNPFDYLTQLQKHPEELRRSPHEWMPWNYPAAVAIAEAATDRA